MTNPFLQVYTCIGHWPTSSLYLWIPVMVSVGEFYTLSTFFIIYWYDKLCLENINVIIQSI